MSVSPFEQSVGSTPALAREPLAGRMFRYAARKAWIVDTGRVAAVALPVVVLFGLLLDGILVALLVSIGLTAVWALALAGAARTVPPMLGVSVMCAGGTAVGLVVASALVAWTPGLTTQLRPLVTTAIGVFLLSTLWEDFTRRRFKRRVLVVGTSEAAATVVDEVEATDAAPVVLLGVVGDGRRSRPDPSVLGDLDELTEIVESGRPDLIVLADETTAPVALERLLDVSRQTFRVVGLAGFFEHAFGRVPLRHVTTTWFMSVLHLNQRPYSRLTKRLFDLTVASIGLVVTAPAWPVIALLVRLSPGPVIYRQVRVGEGGRLFTMYKFRTMRRDAEEPGRPVWAASNDTRVTRVGGVLRLTRLDELPQLWNVLKGEMSIVGPRPERPEFIEALEDRIPFWTRRLLVKPGITGWAQLRRGYAGDYDGTEEKLSYDLWYLRHRNLVVDIAICAKTLIAGGHGAR